MGKKTVYFWTLIFLVGFFYSCDDWGDEKENLSGTWNLNPSNALSVTWESSENISIGGISMPTAAVAELMSGYGNTVLQEELRSITFKADDNIEVNYRAESGSFTTDIYGKYKAISRHDLLYYPDVDKLLKDIDGIDNATLNELKTLAKLGIPVKYSLTGSSLNEAYFYLDTNTIKAMKILFKALESSIEGDTAEDLVIKEVLKALPDALDKTSKIEIGLGFYKINI